MKKLSLILLPLSLLLSSCYKDGGCISGNGSMTTETRTVSVFNQIDADGSYDIYITQDSTQEVKVEAESNLMSRLKTEVSGGKLHIYMSGCVRRMKGVKVYLSAKEIKGIYLNGSGNIHGQNKFTTDNFSAKLNGSGDMDLNVEAPTGSFAVNGSGDIKVKGKVDDCSLSIDGSGNIKAFDLQTKNTNADISGSGDIEVSVSDTLDVNISGSGNVYYKGSPRINIKVSGSGQVIQK